MPGRPHIPRDAEEETLPPIWIIAGVFTVLLILLSPLLAMAAFGWLDMWTDILSNSN